MHRSPPRGRAAALATLASLATGLAPALALLAPSRAWAVPVAGIDCECTATGPYVLRAAGDEMPTALGATASPDGALSVAVTPNPPNDPFITVTRVSGGPAVLNGVPAAAWLFNASSTILAVASTGAGIRDYTLYDLTTTPAARISAPVVGDSRFFWSPHGRYVYYAYPTGNATNVVILEAASGVRVHQDVFTPAIGFGGPDDVFGIIAWGYSPDVLDRTFLYTYGLSNVPPPTVRWNAVDLVTRAWHQEEVPSSGYEVFSPCGDVLGAVVQPSQTSSDARLLPTDFAVNNPTPLFSQTISNATVLLETTAAQHLAQVGTPPSPMVLARNSAPDLCPSVGVPPVSIFAVTGPAFALVPLTFTDQSTPAADLVAWRWSFGDGSAEVTTRNATHAYPAAGTYPAALTVTAANGRSATSRQNVTVAANQPPVASFSVSPAAPASHDLITLTDTSTDDDGIVSRSWSFPTATGDPVVDAAPDQRWVTIRSCVAITAMLQVLDHASQGDSLQAVVPVSPSPPQTVDLPPGTSIAAATTLGCPGDTLRLAAGTYPGGASLDGLNLTGAGAGVSIVEGGSAATGGSVLQVGVPGAFTQHIDRLTIRGGTSGISVASARDGTLLVEDFEVTGAGGGGGISIGTNGGAVVLRRGHLHHNSSSSQGGGLTMFCCSDVTIEDSELDANTAVNDGGGAFVWEAASIAVRRSLFHDNTAGGDGGGAALQVVQGGAVAEVSASRFTGNTGRSGGGAYLDHLLFAGNLVAANHGGGLAGSHSAVVSSTVADNLGAGLDATEPGMTLVNSIVSANSTDLAGTLAGPPIASLVGGAPAFAGPGDYHLTLASPAVDAGANSEVPAFLTTDLGGRPRVAVGRAGGSALVDMGAFELQPGEGGPGTVVSPPPAPGGGSSGGGCHCGTGGGGLGSLGLLLLALRRRRRGA